MTDTSTWGNHMDLMIQALRAVAKECPISVEINDELTARWCRSTLADPRYRRMTIKIDWLVL